MEEHQNYNINLDVKYGHQELIDIREVVRQNKESWFNQTLTQVNDSVVRMKRMSSSMLSKGCCS